MKTPIRLLQLLVLLFAHLSALAQAPATGRVTGRVSNPATREYVRNAEVAVEGTNIVAFSGDDGSYTLPNLPAGEATVTVTYTGYDQIGRAHV